MEENTKEKLERERKRSLQLAKRNQQRSQKVKVSDKHDIMSHEHSLYTGVISEDDYYRRSTEFRLWLTEEVITLTITCTLYYHLHLCNILTACITAYPYET